MIYHLLPEWESFSAFQGGAVSKDIANIMRFEESRIVVCRSSDQTWGFPANRILVIPGLSGYAKTRARRFFPAWICAPILRRVFQPLVSRLKRGDIVWCHSQPFFAAALGREIHSRGAKLIFHAHNFISGPLVRTKFRHFDPDAVIFVSEFMRQESLSRLPMLKNTWAIHNGADEALFYPARSNAHPQRAVPVILFVGRLNPDKGVHVLLHAVRILEQRGVEFRCRIVGSSYVGGSKATSYVESLHSTCPPNVEFAGFRSGKEIGDEYRAADILCCPSIWQEPFGNVNIEAMACGIPVVATRVGGIPEIAAEGGVLLVEPNSAIQIADALQRLVADKQLRAKVAAEGLESFRRRFTWAAIYRQYEAVTDSLGTTSAAEGALR